MIDLARAVILAEDQTGPATESAARNLRRIASDSEFLEKALGRLTGILSFGFATKLVADLIGMQAKVKDLAIEAGMTADQLSRFEEIGRTSGEGLEGIAAAVGKMSKALIEAKDPTTAQAQALKAINVSWQELKALSPDEQLIRIAKAQAEFAPGIEKNAAMMTLFGRGGAKFQVALSEIAEAQKLVSTTTAKQAEEADRLVDELAKLKLQAGLVGRGLMSDLIPGLNTILQAFIEGKNEAGLYEGAVRGLSAAFDAINGTGATAELQRIEDRLKEVKKAADTLREQPWWLSFVDSGPLKDQAAQIEALTKQRDALQHEIHQLELAEQDKRALAGLKGKPRVQFDPKSGTDAENELKQYQSANLELDKQIALVRERERLGRSLTESEKLLSEIEAGKYAKLTPLHQKELKDKAALFSIEQKRAIAAKADLDARLAEAGALGKGLEALKEKVEAAKLENDTYGLTQTQIELVTIARLEERRAQLLGVEGTELQVKALDIEIAKRRELIGQFQRGEILAQLRREGELQGQVFDEAASRGSNFLTDLATHGVKTFSTLRQAANDFGREMLAIFTKRLLLQVGVALTGSTALAAQAGQVGQGTLAGSALTAGASYMGKTAQGTAASGACTSFAAGYQGSTLAAGLAGPTTAGATGLTGAGATAGGLMDGVGAWMASNPYTLVAAVVIIAAIAIARMRTGGEKEGGSYFGSYDSSGAFTGDVTVPGTDNGRFFTPAGGDSVARQWGDTAAAAFFNMLHSLGGTSSGVQFGFGYDKDPRGSADSRVTAMVRGAGGQTLLNSTVTAGRDDEDFNRAIALQTRRALLAGLQDSDLPEAIASILSGVAADVATSDQIDQVFALAGAMKGLLDTLTPLSVEDLVAEAGRSAISAWRAQGEQLRDLANNTDLSVESLNRLSQATGQYRAAAAQLILQFESARTSVAAGISDTLRDFRFQTLDKQGQYNMLRGEASSFASGLGSMEDAGQIVDTVNRIRQLSSQAFGMLSDEDKRAMLAEYESGLKEVQRIADERLVALRDDVKDEANVQLSRQEKIVTDMAAASVRMETAAKTFDAAATRLADASIDVHFTGSMGDVNPEVSQG